MRGAGAMAIGWRLLSLKTSRILGFMTGIMGLVSGSGTMFASCAGTRLHGAGMFATCTGTKLHGAGIEGYMACSVLVICSLATADIAR